MKLALVAGLGLALVAAVPTAFAKAEIGQPAPDFTLTDIDGNAHSLSDFAGRTVVLEWTNHQCPFVVKHYTGNMQEQQKAAIADDVVWLTINSSTTGAQGHLSPDQARAINEEKNWSGTAYLFDTSGEVGRSYDAKVTPHMYIIDGDGVLRYAGGIDSTPSADPADIPSSTQYVRVALEQLAGGDDVAQASTRPYGCSIKYPGT